MASFDEVLYTYVDTVVLTVLTANAGGQAPSDNDALGADLGYTADSILSLIAQVEAALNVNPPPGYGPFWLPKTAKQKKLVNATVRQFIDWVYHQCEAEQAVHG